MTTEPESAPVKGFVPNKLPWIAAGGMLILYLITLNRWITIDSLPQVVAAGGWDWQMPAHGPLFFLVALPFRLLPVSWLPLAMNLFSALCAVLTLALLARSVALLPHDRTHEQRQREHSEHSLLSIPAAWLPPVLAVLVCGLQLTFWENAVATTGEMFNLLLFAWLIRCLLEFRVNERQSWLDKFAIVYGLAVPNNWALIGFFPAFLAAIIWIKGWRFFRWRFVLRMALLGLAGLILYLLLPVLHSFSEVSQAGFWPALRANLVSQKNILIQFPRTTVLLLGLTSLLPVLIISIRWSAFIGDTSAISMFIGNVMFNVVHAMFLGACLWVAFDPPFGPREKGYGLSFLTFYYLGALSIGYFSGYFLLVFGRETIKTRRRSGDFRRWFRKAVVLAIWLILVGVPAGLIYKNFPGMLRSSQPTLLNFTRNMAESLTATNAIVLSDDPRRLFLLRGFLSRMDSGPDFVLVDTRSLQYPNYHRYLAREHPVEWQEFATLGDAEFPIDPISLMRVMVSLSQTRTIYYLHPSFGYYFELFYPKLNGLTSELIQSPTNAPFTPALTAQEFAANEQFWQRIETDVAPKLKKLIREKDADATTAGSFYSLGLNVWGAYLQEHGHLERAGQAFELSAQLNSNNFVASINREYNAQLHDGNREPLKLPKDLRATFEKHRTIDVVIGSYGLFEEPNLCFEQALVFTRNNLFRQGAHQFKRASELNPNNIVARLALTQLLLTMRFPDRAGDQLEELKEMDATSPLSMTNKIEMVRLQATLHFIRKQPEEAEKLLEKALAEFPQNPTLLEAIVQTHLGLGQHSNALTVVEQQLRINPDDPRALINKAALCIHLNQFEQALPPLDRLLETDPDNTAARLNRAIARLQLKRLDEAQSDYEKLREQMPESHRVYFGLGEIAWRKKDHAAALEYYQQYVQFAPQGTEERTLVETRLQELQAKAGTN